MLALACRAAPAAQRALGRGLSRLPRAAPTAQPHRHNTSLRLAPSEPQPRRAASTAATGPAVLRSALRTGKFRPIYDELARGERISRNDLAIGMRAAAPGTTITDEQLDRMMAFADLDGNGHIDFDEFVLLFEEIPDGEIGLASLAEHWLGYGSYTVMDPAMIFQASWRRLVMQRGGGDETAIRLPREILFLGGAPGAGKGTMTPYIMWERGIEAEPVVISSLLQSPAAKRIIEEGGLVSDTEVFAMLLDELSQPNQRNGSLVDGYPRTVVQVELLRLLHAKMTELSRRVAREGGAAGVVAAAAAFPRPHFRMCILCAAPPSAPSQRNASARCPTARRPPPTAHRPRPAATSTSTSRSSASSRAAASPSSTTRRRPRAARRWSRCGPPTSRWRRRSSGTDCSSRGRWRRTKCCSSRSRTI